MNSEQTNLLLSGEAVGHPRIAPVSGPVLVRLQLLGPRLTHLLGHGHVTLEQHVVVVARTLTRHTPMSAANTTQHVSK